MSSDEIAISVDRLSKRYEIYEHPGDRLKQFIYPRLASIFGKPQKQYCRDFWALRDVSFILRKGQTLGIIGKNGSGKSTLLQIICGTLFPTHGEVKVNGRVAALLELGSGFNPEFTGKENAYLNASVMGLSKLEIDERYQKIVDFAGIGDFINQPVKTYSSGMIVRLAFAVIANVNADILVIDEALAVGDVFFTQKCMRFLREFMKTKTVLFVSHDTGAIKNLCNSAIRLDQGRLIKNGSPAEVCDDYLESFYESTQGLSAEPESKTIFLQHSCEIDVVDERKNLIDRTALRNDIKVFNFTPDAPSFGKGHARIYDVRLTSSIGSTLYSVIGGEEITLVIKVAAYSHLKSPIIGFHVKDRLGQALFGDNTYLKYVDVNISCEPGKHLTAKFKFRMPILPIGDYSLSVAVADGSQSNHVQHHWIHDAVHFKSESTSVSTGLIGIPMSSILLEVDG